MMPTSPTSSIHGRFIFSEYCSFADIALPPECVTSDNIEDSIEHAKLEHVHAITEHIATPTAGTTVIHLCRCAGEVVSVKAVLTGSLPVSTRVLSVDCKINGTSCLSAPIDLDSGRTLSVVETGTLGTVTTAADDIVTLVLSYAGSGADPVGLAVSVYVSEAGA